MTDMMQFSPADLLAWALVEKCVRVAKTDTVVAKLGPVSVHWYPNSKTEAWFVNPGGRCTKREAVMMLRAMVSTPKRLGR